jgi:hypothetical protein
VKAGPSKMKRTTSSEKARQFENWASSGAAGDENKNGKGEPVDAIAYARYHSPTSFNQTYHKLICYAIISPQIK